MLMSKLNGSGLRPREKKTPTEFDIKNGQKPRWEESIGHCALRIGKYIKVIDLTGPLGLVVATNDRKTNTAFFSTGGQIT